MRFRPSRGFRAGERAYAGTVLLCALALAAPGAAGAQEGVDDGTEWAAYQDTVERFSDRMKEFNADSLRILDQQEADERQKVSSAYGAAIRRLDESESALRRVAIARLEGFLQKHPSTDHTPDMMFRLADLYFEETEVAFSAQMEDYGRLEAQLEANPNMVLPEPPLKDFTRPLKLYRELVANYPKYELLPDTYYMLAWCLSVENSAQHDPEDARDVYLALIAHDPTSPFSSDANMRLGEYYFDLSNAKVNVPIAIRYYEAVLADGPSGRNYDEAIYKLGWSHYKLDNYSRSLGYLVELLEYSDKQFLKTGKTSAMRPEAIEYLAISYADIAVRQNRRPVEVAIEHLDSVGERKWQHDVMERLADILWLQANWDASVDAFALLQSRWPEDPSNPVYQQNIALIYQGSNRNATDKVKVYPGNPLRDLAKADEAFDDLVRNYVDGTPWYVANRANPDAIAVARGFIETSLGTVAVVALEAGRHAEAAALFKEFLDKFPFADQHAEYEWYRAFALYQSNQYAEAEKQYLQILKNERSPYRDGSRFQIMKVREQLLLAKHGKIEEVPADALTERTVTTASGAQITQYMLSDEHKAFIAACDDLVDREFTDPEFVPKLEKDRAALMYLPAQIYFEHGHYVEARLRFDKVMRRFHDRQEALFSQSLYINSYTNEGDLTNVQKYATAFQADQAGPDSAAKADLKRVWGDINEAAKFNEGDRLIKAGDRAAAAEAFLDFMRSYPNSKYYADALYSAANNLELTGRAEESNRLFEQYIAKYPSDERSKVLYFAIASNYSAILELNKAISYYDTLVRLFPTYKDSPAALYNAAFARVGVGDHLGAARTYEKYATQFPTQDDAETAFWAAAEQWELVGESEALAFYQRYLNRFPAGDPNHVMESQYRIAKSYEKKGDKRRAAQAWGEIQNTFVATNGAKLTSRARSLAAEGALTDLLARYETFKLVKWSSEAKNVEILLKGKPDELKALVEKAVQMIQMYQDYETAAAALYVQGMTFYAYADMAYTMPAPRSLDEDGLAIYLDQIAQQFQIPSEDRGKARLVASLEKANAEKRWSEWNTKALEALHDRDPKGWPSQRQESRGVVRGAAMQVAGPASLPDEKTEPRQ